MFTKEIGQFLYDAASNEVKRTGLAHAQIALDAVAYLEDTMGKLDKAEKAKARKIAKPKKKR